MSTPPMSPLEEELRHLFLGYRISQALYAAASLGIADLLADGPRGADDLANASDAHAPSLARVLRLLASEGVFEEVSEGRFALTPLAEVLRKDVRGPVRQTVLFVGAETTWRSWGNLLHSVRTGEPAFKYTHGVDFFTYFQQHPDEEAVFNQLMVLLTAATTRAVAAAYDFKPFGTIVDVGGGHGALTLGLLEAYPHLRGIVFDQPSVAAGARYAIEAAGLTDRCEAVGGDFFESVPAARDVYVIKTVLHDWDDVHCSTILRSCRQGIAAQGRVLVIELLIPGGNAPSFAKSQDVNMLVLQTGHERSLAEYQALFRTAGFELTRTIPVQGELHIIEGIPV